MEPLWVDAAIPLIKGSTNPLPAAFSPSAGYRAITQRLPENLVGEVAGLVGPFDCRPVRLLHWPQATVARPGVAREHSAQPGEEVIEHELNDTTRCPHTEGFEHASSFPGRDGRRRIDPCQSSG